MIKYECREIDELQYRVRKSRVSTTPDIFYTYIIWEQGRAEMIRKREHSLSAVVQTKNRALHDMLLPFIAKTCDDAIRQCITSTFSICK